MRPLDHNQVNQAIQACLERCYQTAEFLPKIAAFVDELQRSPAWTEREVRAVELAVLKVVRNLVRGPIYPGDATNQPPGTLPRGSMATRMSGA